MADYWRYGDRLAPGQVPVKRLRAEYDDLAPASATYYPREEPRYDDREGRLMLREPESLGVGYGSGLSGVEMAPGGHLGLGGLSATSLGLSAHDDHAFLGHSRLGLESSMMKPSPLGISNGRPDYLPRQESQVPPRARAPLPPDASPTLFVEGLPSDCTRREAAHVFRPFFGFKEVRLVRKEGKRSGSPIVLCFVDFHDAQHAANALEALQGYKFDEMSRESETLRLQFARSPGPQSRREDFHGGRDRDDFPRGGRPFRR
ncbi:hypothetical protein GOP47_0009660 [Adiantum capillus-veneris]|uniref:RRM domain-containing protein n=1 Tax=Adiantum capillus-veneris TaxID=13818 RepID=A0A9D4UX93_ADICA|nr:hypothetical protein GOP47_0009660 [Adiantum capillus-veneris]